MARTLGPVPFIGAAMSNLMTMMQGHPRLLPAESAGFAGVHLPLGAEAAGYYSTAPLEATLKDLIDSRWSTAAAAADGRRRPCARRDALLRQPGDALDVRHVMASGALPPAFPAVRIDGELYWDGGILSNTPVEAVFDDNPRRNSLVFAVHIWNPHGPEPDTIWQVMNRQKDIQYSSRAASHIARQRQIHRLRHIIAELGKLPPAERRRPR